MNFSSPRSHLVTPATDFRQDTLLLADICSEYVTHTQSGWEDAIAGHPSLSSLAATADQHGVLPLFARALSTAGIACVTAQTRARGIAFRNLALAVELVKLIGALRELGIQALAYKGPILAQQLYFDITLRQFSDLDILIAPPDALRARNALCELGYEDIEHYSRPLFRKHVHSQCEWQMTGTRSGTVIELHWAIFPKYVSLDFSVEELKSRRAHISIAGEQVSTLDVDDLVLVLSAHGMKHFWHRLAWLADLALALRVCTPEGLQASLDKAERKGMRRILLVSAALAAQVLRLKLPQAFERAISADRMAQMLTQIMQQALHAGGVSDDLLGENIWLLHSRERWSDRVKIVSRLAFTPGPQEWRWAALPEWAEWLYRPLRMVRTARYLPRLGRRVFVSRKR